MLVAPILLAVTMFSITQRPASLLIAAASPMMMFGNFISQKTNIGQRLRKEAESFEEQFERLEETLYHSHPKEREVRQNEVPAVAVVFDEAMRLGPPAVDAPTGALELLAMRLGCARARRAPASSAPRLRRRSSSTSNVSTVSRSGTG